MNKNWFKTTIISLLYKIIISSFFFISQMNSKLNKT